MPVERGSQTLGGKVWSNGNKILEKTLEPKYINNVITQIVANNIALSILRFVYSETSIKRTPSRTSQVSVSRGCPHIRGL